MLNDRKTFNTKEEAEKVAAKYNGAIEVLRDYMGRYYLSPKAL